MWDSAWVPSPIFTLHPSPRLAGDRGQGSGCGIAAFPCGGLPRAGCLLPCAPAAAPSGPGGRPEQLGPRTAPLPLSPRPAASWSQEHSHTPHVSPQCHLPQPPWEHCSISVLFKESPRVKGLKRELAGESSFPKPWSPRGVFWRGGLSGLLGELGDHAGRLGCCPHSTEHGVEARKELPQAPPALVLSSSAVFHRDLGGHAPESGSGPPGSWGHWAGCGGQGARRSVGLDAWGPGGA